MVIQAVDQRPYLRRPGGRHIDGMRRIVILGGGTGGTIAANRLRRIYGSGEAEIVVVDADDEHVYQPGLLFVPFGLADPGRLVRPRHRQLRAGISFREAGIDRVDLAADQVHLDDGTALGYDVLVIATGARLLPEETEGLTGPGWMTACSRSTPPTGRRRCAARWSASAAAAWWSTSSTCRSSARSRRWSSASWPTATSGAGASATGCSSATSRRWTARSPSPCATGNCPACSRSAGIELVTEFNTGTVQGRGDGAGGPRLISYDDREVPFDLAVVVPLHGGAAYVDRSPGLGDELGFIPVDRHTLQATAKPNIFAIGDATDVPTSKAGSVAHFEGETVTSSVRRLPGRPAGDRRLRRPHQLLHRDRRRQGAAHRLQLRHRAAHRPLPRHGSACRCSANRA